MISGTPKSLDDMVNDLQISKGTASLSVRQGVQISLFRKVGVPGSKRDFYQLHSDAWALTLHTSIAQGNMMAQYLCRAKELVLKEEAAPIIDESIEFFEFVIQQSKQILVQWEERKGSSTK
ncbi:GbsR/MarR family transcriptional regulator [Bacillus mycoides]|uniref:GbsR/MarR family transcriptional regulator n=1 Tax=Bacillus mycoides TaxID=1405 RepID=UPI003D1BE317